MVAKDTQRVCCHGTCAHMEHAGEQLTCNLVHIWNHQQEALAGGKGRCQSTCLQRTVHRTSSTSLRLHLLNHDSIAEQILSALCCPLVHMLRHWRRRSDRIDGSHLAEHVSHMSGTGITIPCHKFLFFCHCSIYLCIIIVCFRFQNTRSSRSSRNIRSFSVFRSVQQSEHPQGHLLALALQLVRADVYHIGRFASGNLRQQFVA